ncbi:MAG: hypothetical protein JWN85_2742, partial [Gammaproteobacteria bacterium]|nr:hypothetical protein [Gammaproteobacteria bacterium]
MKKHSDTDLVSRTSRKAMTRALLLGSWLAAAMLSAAAMAWDQEERENGPVVNTAEGPVRGL